jgi:hypothetical protein
MLRKKRSLVTRIEPLWFGRKYLQGRVQKRDEKGEEEEILPRI